MENKRMLFQISRTFQHSFKSSRTLADSTTFQENSQTLHLRAFQYCSKRVPEREFWLYVGNDGKQKLLKLSKQSSH